MKVKYVTTRTGYSGVMDDMNCGCRYKLLCNRIEILVISYGTRAWKITSNHGRTLEIAKTVFLKILPQFPRNVKGRVGIIKRNCVDLWPLI
jgi:hypothetical protein